MAIEIKRYKNKDYYVFPTTVKTYEDYLFDHDFFDKHEFDKETGKPLEGFIKSHNTILKDVKLMVVTHDEYDRFKEETISFIMREKYPYFEKMGEDKRVRKMIEIEILASIEMKERFILMDDPQWIKYKKENA